MRFLILNFLFTCTLVLTGCTGLPKGIDPIDNFELERYLGKWYEVARLDHRFERGLENVTAEYSMRESGLVNVLNKGYKTGAAEWKSAEGKAKFKSDPQTGHLLVSFFGPVYGSYVIFQLDDYKQAYVAGNNRNSLWFLSRTPTVSDADKTAFLEKVDTLGFDTDEIIWVDHSSR